MNLSIDGIQTALHKARLRCTILEADLEAKKAARMGQEKWALRYHRIIDQLMNGDDNVVVDDDDTHDDVRSQETSEGEDPYYPQPPQSISRLLCILHCPAVHHIQIHLV